jgi:hypothetical protein
VTKVRGSLKNWAEKSRPAEARDPWIGRPGFNEGLNASGIGIRRRETMDQKELERRLRTLKILSIKIEGSVCRNL